MSKMDVNLYYLQVESQYFEMLDNLKEVEKEAQNGNMSQEEYDQMKREVDLLKSNYDRLSWIMLLLNKPNRKNKERADMNKEWYQYLQGASKEAILDENRDVLANLKRYIKTGKAPNE